MVWSAVWDLSARVNISKTNLKLNERSEFNLWSLKYLRVLINPKLHEQTIRLFVNHIVKNWPWMKFKTRFTRSPPISIPVDFDFPLLSIQQHTSQFCIPNTFNNCNVSFHFGHFGEPNCLSNYFLSSSSKPLDFCDTSCRTVQDGVLCCHEKRCVAIGLFDSPIVKRPIRSVWFQFVSNGLQLFGTGLHFFALWFGCNCTAHIQSEWRNFVHYMIRSEIIRVIC